MRAESLDQWIDRQYRYSIAAIQQSISRTDLVKDRPGFGTSVRAAKGSIVASPVLGSYDPDPDYFFHWFRDSAIVIDALRIAYESDAGQDLRADLVGHLRDFVRFSGDLQKLQGRALSAEQRAKVAPDFVKYLRDDGEISAVRAENVVAETRVNPDGTLDISSWPRPQHDGPPLRALALMRCAKHAPAEIGDELAALIRSDVEFTRQHWREPSFDIWEEERGLHYYTLRVSAAALQADHPEEARKILAELDRLTDELDISVILGANHANERGPLGVDDPRIHSTLHRLEAHFAQAYPINRGRAAPALGRYPGDVYYDGGPWYVATLAAAELCYRNGWVERGDEFLETVRAFTPESGEMSEQFDRETGAQRSARHLGWSYAAFISCAAARHAATS